MTLRQRTLVMISILSALQRKEQVGKELRHARQGGIPRKALEELFIHFSLILGFPTMLDGLERLQILWPRVPRIVAPKPSPAKGRKILASIYGDQTEKLLRNLKQLHDEAADWIIRDVYGKVFSRHGLSLRERELVTVAVLSLQGLERQLYSHMRGALRLGVREETLQRALRLVERVTGRRQRGARAILSQVVSQRKMS